MKDRKIAGLIIGIAMAHLVPAGIVAAGQTPAEKILSPETVKKALAYSKERNGLSLVIMQNGRIILEDYHNGFESEDSHILTSATKSFSGAILAALIDDGLVSSFDEKVSETIAEWKNDPGKSLITLRQLLSLSSGLDPGPVGRVIPYAEAVKSPLLSPPGTAFKYGPVPFQVFGEVVKRKLPGENALSYLTSRIFRPIGLQAKGWRIGRDGNPNLASGADLQAREWIKFGEFIRLRGRWGERQIVRPELIAELLKPSAANPAYGLSFWLKTGKDVDAEEGGSARAGNESEPQIEVIMAAGAGKQRLYVVDGLGLVVVRQGKASPFRDSEFLSILLSR